MNLLEGSILMVAILFNAGANVLLKFGMRNAPELARVGLVRMLLTSVGNLYVWLGLISFGIAFVFYSVVLTRLKLGLAYPVMTSAGFVIVTIFAIFLFDEKLSWLKIVGIAVIALGIWLVALAK